MWTHRSQIGTDPVSSFEEEEANHGHATLNPARVAGDFQQMIPDSYKKTVGV